MAEDIPDNRYELFFGLISPVGADTEKTVKALKRTLNDIGYQAHEVRLSQQLKEIDSALSVDMPEDQRINAHMDTGNRLRRETKMENAVAILGLTEVRRIRDQNKSKGKDTASGHAYIFNSLKHTGEIKTLRALYGEHFYAVSVYEPTGMRIDRLIKKISESQLKKGFFKKEDKSALKISAEHLIERDQVEVDDVYGQSVRKIFPLADLFVSHDDQEDQITRFIRLLFGAPFVTPTVDEYGMYFAHAAALRTSDPSRQVGAVITTEDGELLTAGCNEVPKAGGGAYWEGSSKNDYRDFQDQEIDPNIFQKHKMFAELFVRLKKGGWLNADLNEKSEEELIEGALYDEQKQLLEDTRIDNIIEFGRVVHAEMHAITEAARRGVSLQDMILYCTTYPCHMCARHIISSGIKRVLFIEPYPKSLTKELYGDMIMIDGIDAKNGESRIRFDAFIGLSPRQYPKLFKMIPGSRKDKKGKLTKKDHVEKIPRIDKPEFSYTTNEDTHIKLLLQKIEALNSHKGDSR